MNRETLRRRVAALERLVADTVGGTPGTDDGKAPGTAPFYVRISDATRRRVAMAAARRGMRKRAIVEQAIEEWLARHDG